MGHTPLSHIGHTPLSLSQWSLSYLTLPPNSLFSYSLSWTHSCTLTQWSLVTLFISHWSSVALYNSTLVPLYISHWSLVTLSVSHRRRQELGVGGAKNGAQSAPPFWPHPLFEAYKRRVLGVSLQPGTRPFIGCLLNLNEPANLIRRDLHHLSPF